MPRRKATTEAERAEAELREFALAFPDATKELSRGYCAIKVRKRVFAVLGAHDEGLDVEAKLPRSSKVALLLPFARPANAGRAVCGWVAAHFGPDERPPIGLLEEWIEESYRAVAPKKLVAQLRASSRPLRARP